MLTASPDARYRRYVRPLFLFFDYCTLGTMHVSKFGGVVKFLLLLVLCEFSYYCVVKLYY